MFPDHLESERLLLRPVGPADAPALFACYAGDAFVARFTTWRPHADAVETERFLVACAAATASRTFALVLRDTGAPVGVLDLRRPVPSRLEVGYALGRGFWGQGLMTEALRAVIAWAFAQPAIWRLGAVVDSENHASARVLEKAGLRREGILRRWLVHPALGDAPRDCLSYAVVRDGPSGSAVDRAAVIPAGMERIVAAAGYVPALRVGALVFCAGQVGRTADLQVIADPEQQFAACWDNLASVLAEAGCGFEDVVDMTSYHVDLDSHFATFRAVKDRLFPRATCPWTVIGVAALARPGLLAEIKCTAVRRTS